MSCSAPTQELHFVIGGAGFLGSHIVDALVQRGEKTVASFDIREPVAPIAGVQYYEGDLTDRDALAKALADAQEDLGDSPKKERAGVVYHTASPVAGLGPELNEKVNVTGTNVVISVCQDERNSVRKLVFTSSAGVVFTGQDLIYVDERMQPPEHPMDSYNDTKMRAEQAVLAANGKHHLLTIALRPAGIFGPGDRQALPGMFNVLATGRTKFQIGRNQNLFDWTYVGNVAHAHLLAADKLSAPEQYASSRLVEEHLPVRALGVAERDTYRSVPLSVQRQDVPKPARDYARNVQALIEIAPDQLDQHTVYRNRFDPFFSDAHPTAASAGNPNPAALNLARDAIPAAGEAFFITNGQPICFWDFPRALWYRYNGHVDPRYIVLPLYVALVIAFLAECFSKLTGRPVQFTRYRVTYTGCTRFYNIEKARRILSYEPIVGMDEAIDRSVQWWKAAHPPHREAAKTK
ncbi:3beta-hydroxysteroid-4alpha-carboxylate 3-dehydrogenas(decarboxylating) [Malassezia vespertilionis]|uniref:Erg26p n=1 Tax=Malassezia vespertilionis TaxID=2020962 RepID=A0A2N1J775_9BASI|nr:3beta-hydroxysteroid-4alpha-carboxylate 3-dehydrogenas(decarboxylating) [Malassezia vespertilionis]PKI82394.1 Erg26p [Malassezia vespertilionis]WFD08007.1 3beta-hydroxysteroid-4alpha-carboxylate 3-dehydrogenas(decarboxylating) [Malassezia vespertilionis]